LILFSNNSIASKKTNEYITAIENKSNESNPWKNVNFDDEIYDPRELKGDKPYWTKVPMGNGSMHHVSSWGSRTGKGTKNYRRSW
jgi:hypothetical protein